MNIYDIDYFASVAEHKNIGKAAEALGLTQSALSRSISRLEVLAGQRLFTRHPRGVELTPAGEVLLHRASKIRVEYDDAMREMQQMRSGQLGLLRVGYTPSVDQSLVMAATRQLIVERVAAHLKMFELVMQDLIDMLHDGQLDIIIGPAPELATTELKISPLYRDHLLVVADREHPLFKRLHVNWADIAAEPWLLPQRNNRTRSMLEDKAMSCGLPPLDVRIESHTVNQAQFNLLRGTRLLSMCSEWLVKPMRALGLEVLEVTDFTLSREIVSIHRAGAYVSPLGERLEELLRQHRHSPT